MAGHVGVRVECYSGHEYAERPSAVHWEGVRLQVTEIESSWRTPEGMSFRVRLQDGRACMLAYSALADSWTANWPVS